MLLLVLLLTVPIFVSGQCFDFGCCPGRNDDCINGGCFCDEACFLEFNDCCEDYLSFCTGSDEISAFPRFGTMLGGTSVSILGNFGGASSITCQFGSSSVSTAQRSANNGVVECISPTYFGTGRVPLTISIDGDVRRSNFLYLPPDQVTDAVTRVDKELWDDETGPFRITWDNSQLSTGEVDIEMWRYREVESGVPQFSLMSTIASGTSNDGSFEFNRPIVPQIEAIDVGVIRVVERRSNGSPASLWSDVHVADYFAPINNLLFCRDWFIREGSLGFAFRDNRQACPCTLRAARIDSCRFSPDPFCNELNSDNPLNCYRKPGAIHCVRARFPSVADGGQECCYREGGQLINVVDELGGGIAHRIHHTSAVPFFSNFLADIVPLFRCCFFSSQQRICNNFKLLRPSQMCSGYQGPVIVWAGGDPHFVSLGGFDYTFNGLGEFLYTDVNDGQFVAQIRTGLMETGQMATVITAVAAKHRDSDTFHMELLPSGSTEVRILTKDNGMNESIGVDFTMNQGGFGTTGLTITEEGPTVVAQFSDAIALRVYRSEGMLFLRLLLPEALMALPTRGLLGIWNSDTADDLTDSNGDVQPNSAGGILRFGNSWNVSEDAALFFRQPGATPPFFFPDFVPITDPPQNADVSEESVEMCRGNAFCLFDLHVTGSAEVAQVTMQAVDDFESDKIEITENEVTCPLLEDTDILKVIVNGSRVGDTASYYCVEGFILIGAVTTTCTSVFGGPLWSNSPPACSPDIVDPVPNCPSGWTYFDGECYIAVSDDLPLEHDGRLQACQARQGNLAVLEPYAAHTALLNLLQLTSGTSYAIGLTDLQNDGTYRWTDGREPTQTSWAFGEPASVNNDEDCAFIRSPGFLWEDRPCNTQASFICQRHASRDTNTCGTSAEASVGYMLSATPNDTRRCVATLINAKWAVTSATCGWANRVVFGARTYSDSPPQNAQVRTFTFLPDPHFNIITRANDVALLLLDEPVTINSLVNPMCVHTSSLISSNCAVSSWGSFRNEIATELQTNTFTNVGTDVCGVVDPFLFIDSGVKQCMANQDSGVFVPCEGDAGAPFHCLDALTNRQTLVAVVAEGICHDTTFNRLEIGTRMNVNDFTAFVTEADIFDCTGNGVIFRPQICNQQCDCPFCDEEIGCPGAEFGRIFAISSPKFGMGPTNRVDRTWLFRAQNIRTFVITIEAFTLDPSSGSLQIGQGRTPGNQGTVMHTITAPGPVLVPSEYVWIVYEKRSLASLEGFRATVRIDGLF